MWNVLPFVRRRNASFAVIFVLLVIQTKGDEIDNAFPPGYISPILHQQSLSHFAFHSPSIQKALANPYSPSTITIVGVEYGKDLIHFAQSGYRVIAIEPSHKHNEYLSDLISKHPNWNITLLPFAAGNDTSTDSTTKIEYKDEIVNDAAQVKKLDDMLDAEKEMAVLSIDIQGNELEVIQGGLEVLKKGGVSSIWIEAIACNSKVNELLNVLNDLDYVILDFVPWGKSNNNHSNNDVPKGTDSFVMNGKRPSEFNSYLDWMCDERKKGFQWLQTDFVAIQRKLIEDVLSTLLNLGDVFCDSNDSNCLLRQLNGISTSQPESDGNADVYDPKFDDDEDEEFKYEYEQGNNDEKEDL